MSEKTFGDRLDEQAQRMVARLLSVPPWTAPFRALLDHLAGLPSAGSGRFTRTEATGGEPATAPRGRPLPAGTAARLRTIVGPGAEAMRVHDDETADETARAHRADAVTIGADVFFQHGRFGPEEPRGFGLLVHEATHVVERLRPGASSQRATASTAAAEENLALTRETAVTPGQVPVPAGGNWHSPAEPPPGAGHHVAVVPVMPPDVAVPAMPPTIPSLAVTGPMTAPPAPIPTTPALGPMTTPVARPMAAAVDRLPAPTLPPTGQPQIDVDALRTRIMRDLMRQLRDEFERGA